MNRLGELAAMDTTLVEQLGHRLAVRGRELADDWAGHESALADLERAIGDDVLGAAFRAMYATESATVKAAAQLVAASLRRDGEIAGTSARLYAEADGLAAGLHRPPSSPDPRA